MLESEMPSERAHSALQNGAPFSYAEKAGGTSHTAIDLEKLVAQPTWREELRIMVEAEQLDPWNIDLVQIADKFLVRVKLLQTLDLVVPANLILAAAILLHLKSEALKFEEEQVPEAEVYIDEERPAIEVPVLTLRTRIPPKRHITLVELIDALEDAFATKVEREEHIPAPPEPMSLVLPDYTIEQRMANILDRVTKQADSEGLVTFFSLIKNRTREEIISTLIPLLHLAKDEKIDIFQEKMFGEIFVRLRITVA